MCASGRLTRRYPRFRLVVSLGREGGAPARWAGLGFRCLLHHPPLQAESGAQYIGPRHLIGRLIIHLPAQVLRYHLRHIVPKLGALPI